jgi:phospholipase C
LSLPNRKGGRRWLALAAALLLSGSAVGATFPAHGGTAPAAHAAARPCGGSRAPRTFRHVVWILMENHNTDQIAGHSPYLNRLAARCGLATSVTAIRHPSLPNYLALTSGGTHGVTDDGPPAAHPIGSNNLFHQLGRRGWRAYEQGMPSNCARSDSGRYAVKHNPAAYYTDLAGSCRRRDVPLKKLGSDLSHKRLARFSFITPNLCNDEHDCSIPTGDRWLSHVMPTILSSSGYLAGRTLVIVTYDEGGRPAGHDPVYTVVVARSVRPGTVATSRYSHYSTLRTTEAALGLKYLGRARTATGYRRPFHL